MFGPVRCLYQIFNSLIRKSWNDNLPVKICRLLTGYFEIDTVPGDFKGKFYDRDNCIFIPD